MLNGAINLLAVPAVAKQGQPFDVRLLVTNNGTERFVPGSDRLGAMQPRDNTNWGNSRIDLPSPIEPGRSLDFVASVLPTKSGALPFQWQPVREHVAWFGTPSSMAVITVEASSTPEPSASMPGPRMLADDLVSRMIINTGPFPADGVVRRPKWTNTTGRRLLIASAKIWLGVDMGRVCDAHGELTRDDGSIVAVGQFDHYTDGPAGAGIEKQDFGLGHMALESGESLTFSHMANSFGRGGNAHFTVTVWARYDSQ